MTAAEVVLKQNPEELHEIQFEDVNLQCGEPEVKKRQRSNQTRTVQNTAAFPEKKHISQLLIFQNLMNNKDLWQRLDSVARRCFSGGPN